MLQEWVNQVEIPCSPSKPFLVVLSGLSGSGKSTVSRFLANHYQAAWISSDIERKRLHGLKPEESSQNIPDFYSQETTRKTFEYMAQLARQLMAQQYPVILDSCVLKQTERDEFCQIATDAQLPYLIIFCEAPLPELTRRVTARQKTGTDASEATEAVINLQKKWLEPPNPGSNEKLLRLNTANKLWKNHLKQAINRFL